MQSRRWRPGCLQRNNPQRPQWPLASLFLVRVSRLHTLGRRHAVARPALRRPHRLSPCYLRALSRLVQDRAPMVLHATHQVPIGVTGKRVASRHAQCTRTSSCSQSSQSRQRPAAARELAMNLRPSWISHRPSCQPSPSSTHRRLAEHFASCSPPTPARDSARFATAHPWKAAYATTPLRSR